MKNIGPGSVIAAAFIGPGTVTMCTIAGSQYGFALLWALLLSIIITIFLQTTAVKIGIISQKSLSSTIVSQFNSKAIRMMSVVLILSAILIGNIAYEAGNISGGVLGLEAMFGDLSFSAQHNDEPVVSDEISESPEAEQTETDEEQEAQAHSPKPFYFLVF